MIINDMLKLLNDSCDEVFEDNFRNGFYDDYHEVSDALFVDELKAYTTLMRKSQMIALIHSELSEALEAIRKSLKDDKLPHRSGEEVEIADTVIRILDYAGAWGLDLAGAIEEKLEYNRNRGYKHGKSF